MACNKYFKEQMHDISVSVGGDESSATKPIEVTAKCWTCNWLGADVCTHESTFTMDWSKCATIIIMVHIADRDVNMTYSACDFIGSDDVYRRLIIFMMSCWFRKIVSIMFDEISKGNGSFGSREHGSKFCISRMRCNCWLFSDLPGDCDAIEEMEAR